MNKSLFIIAGEASADTHGAALVQALRARHPQWRFVGIGGEKLQLAGMELVADITGQAVVGFWEVIKHLAFFRRLLNTVSAELHRRRPDALLLIDFPGFNLRLAERIKRELPDMAIFYYISPQVWAWGQQRIKLISRIITKMIVVFPFEQTLYQHHHIDAAYVGHPLIQQLAPLFTTPAPNNPRPVIALLPGSREMELRRHLPVMLAAAACLAPAGYTFRLFPASPAAADIITQIVTRYPSVQPHIITANHYAELQRCDFAWVCSGTATLETALLGVPLLILYKTSILTWALSRLLVKIKHIGLVNIVANAPLAPEFIQYQATAQALRNATQKFFSATPQERQSQRQKLIALRDVLGQLNAGEQAARVISEELQQIKTINQTSAQRFN